MITLDHLTTSLSDLMDKEEQLQKRRISLQMPASPCKYLKHEE